MPPPRNPSRQGRSAARPVAAAVEPPAPLRGRPPVRQAAVRDVLRQALVSGRWKPGERLPPRLRLVEELDTTNSTLQSALDDLIAEGQVVAKGALGTFVADAPPYLGRFGLMLPSAAGEHGDMNRLWRALSVAAERPRTDGRRIEIFYGPHRRFASPSFDRLIDECSRHLIAGLIVVAPPSMIAGTPVATAPIPRVYISAGPAPEGDAILSFDQESFRRKAIAALARSGCRRVAVLAGAGLIDMAGEAEAWERDLAAAGMQTRPSWVLGCDIEYIHPTQRLVRLLFSRPDDRPDGLVVADDHLLAPAGRGLAAEGLAAGRDVQVVAHANFPLPSGCDVQAQRIGFHAGRTIDAALAYCVARRRRERPSISDLRIRAESEEDLADRG